MTRAYGVPVVGGGPGPTDGLRSRAGARAPQLVGDPRCLAGPDGAARGDVGRGDPTAAAPRRRTVARRPQPHHGRTPRRCTRGQLRHHDRRHRRRPRRRTTTVAAGSAARRRRHTSHRRDDRHRRHTAARRRRRHHDDDASRRRPRRPPRAPSPSRAGRPHADRRATSTRPLQTSSAYGFTGTGAMEVSVVWSGDTLPHHGGQLPERQTRTSAARRPWRRRCLTPAGAAWPR